MLSPPSMSPDNFVMFAIWTLGSAMESASFPMVYSITLTTTSPSPLRSSKYGLSCSASASPVPMGTPVVVRMPMV